MGFEPVILRVLHGYFQAIGILQISPSTQRSCRQILIPEKLPDSKSSRYQRANPFNNKKPGFPGRCFWTRMPSCDMAAALRLRWPTCPGSDANGAAALALNHLGGYQNYDPFLGTLNIRCRIIIGIQKGTIILSYAHLLGRKELKRI